jgi:predicted nuclease with RNAse H fold
VRCVAVDWSGRATGAQETIWIAAARDGELEFLENGRSRESAVDWVIDAARSDPDLVAGFDFCFSFPSWYCRRQGWRDGPQVWRGISGAAGEARLAREAPPFWGRTSTRPVFASDEPQLRATEGGPRRGKSVFQIAGAGAVGTGSLRGMPLLLRLREAGFSIWPFDFPAVTPLVVELYPRRLYPPAIGLPRLSKRSWSSRRAHLEQWFPHHAHPLLERAAGSEDAFDAAVCALVMTAHTEQLRALPARADHALEGMVWEPEER